MDWLRSIWIARIYHDLRYNFWFIPSLMAVAAIIISVFLIDTRINSGASLDGSTHLVKAISLDSARSILSTISGAMITVVSLVFSMTLVALTMVSQQLGPRILQQFMNDRVVQVVLGLFVATFIFSLIILTRVDQSEGYVPGSSILIAAFMAVVCLGAIIHFIHHIARRIQADVIVAELGRTLHEACDALVSSGTALTSGTGEFASEEDADRLVTRFDREKSAKINAKNSGYLNMVDEAALAEHADSKGVVVRIDVPPGSFCLEGLPVFTAIGTTSNIGEESDHDLSKFAVLDPQRTSESSVEFNLNALVEIALRALSPGINDPFTSMTCIDRLTDCLRILLAMPSGLRIVRHDERVRVIYRPRHFDHYLTMAFAPIRQAASRDAQVLLHLCTALERLELLAPDAYRDCIAKAQDDVVASARTGSLAEPDLQLISARRDVHGDGDGQAEAKAAA